jgi:hypothetical protein
MTHRPPFIPRQIHEAQLQQLEEEILLLLASRGGIGSNTIWQTLGGRARSTQTEVRLALERLLYREAIMRTGLGITRNNYRYFLARR